MNGWWARFNRRGDVASGAGEIWVNDKFILPGNQPDWFDDDTVLFKGTGDRPFTVHLPSGEIVQRDATPHVQYAAGAGKWASSGARKYGGVVIRVAVDPSNGDLAELVEYGGQNEDRSIFLRGTPIVEHQPVSDPQVRDGLLVWTLWTGGPNRETWGFNGALQALKVFQGGWEGNPVPVLAGEPWVLVQTNRDLRIHPWGSSKGYLIETGEDKNFNPDIRYEVGVDQLQVIYNDDRGNLGRKHIGLQEERVDLSGSDESELPDEWLITPRTEPEMFAPGHTCSTRPAEKNISPDGTGFLPNYPQNVIGVGQADAVPLVTRLTLPIMLGSLGWPTPEGREFDAAFKTSGLEHRVISMWCATGDENPINVGQGAPSAELIAQYQIARWKEMFPSLPAPPVIWYVNPDECRRADWFHPPSVGCYQPEFYFTPGAQSSEQIELEIWDKANIFIDKLGWSKPWIPIWQCYRRAWDKPTNMPLIARLQTRFFEASRQIEAELQKRMSPEERRTLGRIIRGNGFFTVLRKEGAIEYPEAMDAHARIFAAIPKGAIPSLRFESEGEEPGVDPQIEIPAKYPKKFSRREPLGLWIPFNITHDRPILKISVSLEGDGGKPLVPKFDPPQAPDDQEGRYLRGLAWKPVRNGLWWPLVKAWDDQGRQTNMRGPHQVEVTEDPIDILPDGSLSFPILAVFYYGWFYGPDGWGLGTHYTPSLGRYDLSDPTVIDAHIDDMEYGKIRAAIASWWGQKHKTDLVMPSLLKRSEGHDLKWALYYEFEGHTNPSEQQIRLDLEYIRDRYAGHPNYLRVNGKWVIFVYSANDTCEVVTRWRQAANDFGAYIVMKVVGGFADCPDQPDSWHQYGPANAVQTAWDKNAVLHSYNISPGFWYIKDAVPRLVRDLARWYQNIRDMIGSKARWQLITSYNEGEEGTAIEPSEEWKTKSGHGAYFDALARDGEDPDPDPDGEVIYASYADYITRRWDELKVGTRSRAVAAREGLANSEEYERLNPEKPDSDPRFHDGPRYFRIAEECKAIQCPALIRMASELHHTTVYRERMHRDVGLNVKASGNRWEDPRLPKPMATDILCILPTINGRVVPGPFHIVDMMFMVGSPFATAGWDDHGVPSDEQNQARPFMVPPIP